MGWLENLLNSPAPAPTGCGELIESNSCLARGSKPEYATPDGPLGPDGESMPTYDINDPNRPVLEWRISRIRNCDGSTTGISVVAHFGSEGEVTAELIEDGEYLTAIIRHQLSSRVGYPIEVIIRGGNNSVQTVLLSPPEYVSADNENNVCALYPHPRILGNITTIPNLSEITLGTLLRASVPLSSGVQCDGKTGLSQDNTLNSWFIIEDERITADIDRDAGTYYAERIIAQSGNQIIYFLVEDTAHLDPLTGLPAMAIPLLLNIPYVGVPEPRAFVVTPPNPEVNYNVDSGLPVEWQIYAENYDHTTNGLSAVCDFGPLGNVSATGNTAGIITIQNILTQRLTGSFPCDITGGNGEVLENGAILYPPYYSTPSSEISLCERNSNAPQIGAVSVNPSSINAQGQIYYGAPVTFDLPNTTDCDNEPSDLEVTLFAGSDTAAMPLVGGIYSATLNANYWGTPVYAVVYDRERGTEASSFLYSLPPIVPAPLSACEEDPSPHAYAVVGPTPDRDYDVSSGTSVLWQIYSENCDGSTNGLSAECNFGPPGTISGTSDETGVITISTPIAQRLSGNFPCDITGSNGAELRNGAILYPPYYQQTP